MMQSTPIVFVVDDDVRVRSSLRSLIETAGWQVQTFGSATEFLANPRTDGPSCLVLDVMLPDLNGLDLQERISADRADMPIIVISGYGDVPMAVRAMRGGAIEFLTKPFRDDMLFGAIDRAFERSRNMLNDIAEDRLLRKRLASLTRREREVMVLVVAGQSNKQVAWELGISEVTVKAHRGKTMRKMNARSLAHLVAMVCRHSTDPASFAAYSERHWIERPRHAGALTGQTNSLSLA